MYAVGGHSYEGAVKHFQAELLAQSPTHVGEWQSQRGVGNHPMNVTYELENAIFEMPVPFVLSELADIVKPNLPWAEDHFLERVSGEPLNPPPSEAWWPYAVQGNAEHKDDEVFSHTYPERFWPKLANRWAPVGERLQPLSGIRFPYGDLNDLVKKLARNPGTRQAYLPVWFPEDLGAPDDSRVPCTLGYHFLIRNDHLNCTYLIRSCDFIRHFPDDVYMAARLMQWVSLELRKQHVGAPPGKLTFHAMSLHIFQGDYDRLSR